MIVILEITVKYGKELRKHKPSFVSIRDKNMTGRGCACLWSFRASRQVVPRVDKKIPPTNGTQAFLLSWLNAKRLP